MNYYILYWMFNDKLSFCSNFPLKREPSIVNIEFISGSILKMLTYILVNILASSTPFSSLLLFDTKINHNFPYWHNDAYAPLNDCICAVNRLNYMALCLILINYYNSSPPLNLTNLVNSMSTTKFFQIIISAPQFFSNMWHRIAHISIKHSTFIYAFPFMQTIIAYLRNHFIR